MALKGLLVLFAASQASEVALRQGAEVPEAICKKAFQVAKLCQAEQQQTMPQVLFQKIFQVVPQETIFYLSWGGLFALSYGLWRLLLDLKALLQFLTDIKGLLQKARKLFKKFKVDAQEEDKFKNVFVQGPAAYRPIGRDAIDNEAQQRYHDYKREGDWGAVWM